MSAFDKTLPDVMQKYAVPGGAIAVVRDGRLFYARGFGYADVENKTPVQPDALFRIASVAKPITAAAIMKLVEEGRLKVDDRVAPFIAHLAPAPGAAVDPRWEQITIRHLLNHTGGWDRTRPDGGFDPIDRPGIAAAAVGAPAPASAETLIRYMKGMPLDFNPGEKFRYSNLGYIILGRVIERASGMPYQEYVRTRVLEPVGANRTRQGRSRMSDAFADEVKYYTPTFGVNAPLVPSVFPGEGPVPVTYGGFHLEAGDASGAWVSSTVDPAIPHERRWPPRSAGHSRCRTRGGDDWQRPHGRGILSRWRVLLRLWLGGSPGGRRGNVVAHGVAAGHDERSWALAFKLRVGRSVQCAPFDRQPPRRGRYGALEGPGCRHFLSDT